MSLLDELRAAYPDNEKLKALSDPELVALYSQATGASLDLSAMDLGLDPKDYIQNKGTWEDVTSGVGLATANLPAAIAGAADIVNPLTYLNDRAYLSEGVRALEDATGLGGL